MKSWIVLPLLGVVLIGAAYNLEQHFRSRLISLPGSSSDRLGWNLASSSSVGAETFLFAWLANTLVALVHHDARWRRGKCRRYIRLLLAGPLVYAMCTLCAAALLRARLVSAALISALQCAGDYHAWEFAVLVYAAASAFLFFMACLTQLEDRVPRCATCEYDLTGNVSGKCPECGTPIESEAARPKQPPPY